MAGYYLLRWSGIILLGLLIYGQTFHFNFVFDDYIFIVTNPFVKNFNNFSVMWHAFPMTRFMGMFSFALNYYFGQLDPRGYHIFNCLVHLIATGFVWALADLLFKITKWLPSKNRLTKELPFIIAVIFLVHPCQTQAVTYIAQRFESMATVFYLATIYFYLSARVQRNRVRQIIFMGLAGFSMIFGMLTKEVILTVPVMILAAEWILFPKKDNKIFYVAFAVGGVLLYMLFVKLLHDNLRVLFVSIPSESHDGDILTPLHYVLTQMRVFLTFIRILVFPIHQALDYDYPASSGLLHPPLTLVGLAVILGIISLTVRLRRSFPLIAFGLAWVLITFSINLAPRSNVIFEHKLYLISFGFFLAAVSSLSVLIQNQRTLLKIFICIIAVLAFATFQRNKVWANEVLLWEDNLKMAPNKERVNANLGRVYGTQGQYEKAIYYLNRAVAIKPDNITYENLGVIYSEVGKNDQALENLNKSIAMDPTYYLTYIKRSWVYQTQHNYTAGMADLDRVLQIQPYSADAHIERGMLWSQMGHPQEALKDFHEALNIDPYNREAAAYISHLTTPK